MPAQIVAASVKILCVGSGCGSGTCVLVDQDEKLGLIITNSHVVSIEGKPDGQQFKGLVQAFFPNGKVHGCLIVARDTEADLAGLLITADASTPAVPLATTHPTRGMAIWQVGYPRGYGPVKRAGVVNGYNVAQDKATEPRLFIPSFTIDSGDSGSGVFLQSERALCGVMWGQGEDRFRRPIPGRAAAVELKDLRSFVETKCLPFFRKRPKQPKQPQQPPNIHPPAAPMEDARVEDLLKRIVAVEKGVQDALAAKAAPGMAGPPGPPGKPGRDGSDGRDAAAPLLDPIYAEIGQAKKIGADVQAEQGRLGSIIGQVTPWLGYLPWIAGGAATGGALPMILGGIGLYRRFSGSRGGGGVFVTDDLLAALRRATPAQPVGDHAAPAVPAPVVITAAPPPQVVRTEQNYVPFQAPNGELAAYKRAMEEIAKRHPGSVDVLETLKAYAKQFEAAQPK